MARYYFHLASSNSTAPDRKGYDFPSAMDAYVHGRRLVIEASRYLTEQDGRWIMRVQSPDETFEMILLVPNRKRQSLRPSRISTFL
jgi:hypothetical protein